MSLSDKIHESRIMPSNKVISRRIDVEDVKEFIRDLKNELSEMNNEEKQTEGFCLGMLESIDIIDKLAGKELTNG